MPIRCPFNLPRLTDETMRPIDYEVLKHAFASHSARGRLCDESVYQNDLVQRLQDVGIEAEKEVRFALSLRNFEIFVKIDLIVGQKVIYELKTVEQLNAKHEAQCLGYLFMADATRGKLINFRPPSVESRFVNTSRTAVERRKFELQMMEYSGDSLLPQVVRELVEDWGTGLSPSLYRKAILKCAGDEFSGDYSLPLAENGRPLGNQRFRLLDRETGLAVTTYPDDTNNCRNELLKIVAISPLRRLHLVNITHGQVYITTIKNDRKIL